MIGNFGDAEVFSFHATKFFNTFEGGAIATNDDELATKIRLMKNFGFAGYDNVIYLGTNGKMSEVSAAMGLTGLESLEDVVAINRSNYQLYRTGLAGIPGIDLVTYDESERANFQYIVLEVDESRSGVSRDLLVSALHAENVLVRRYFYPGCHRSPVYRSLATSPVRVLPITERLSEQLMSFPTGTALDGDQIETVCHLTRFIIENGVALTSRLADDELLASTSNAEPA
jgi:dTDP-4-amino-4,6-dideoxygalactose transaminase